MWCAMSAAGAWEYPRRLARAVRCVIVSSLGSFALTASLLDSPTRLPPPPIHNLDVVAERGPPLELGRTLPRALCLVSFPPRRSTFAASEPRFAVLRACHIPPTTNIKYYDLGLEHRDAVSPALNYPIVPPCYELTQPRNPRHRETTR